MRVSEITGVGRLNVDDRIELLPMNLLHGEDAVERLAVAAAQATAVSELMRELHERDWSVKLRGGIDGLRAEALAAGDALAELEESATEAGAPAGTLIEWGPEYELDELEDRALLAQAGVVLAGPRYDPPPAGWMVSDSDGVDHLCADDDAAHERLVEAIDALAVGLARQFPDSDEIIQGVLKHKQRLELGAGGLQLGQVEIGNTRLHVRALPANYFRWEGFKHGLRDPDRRDMLDTVYAGWGVIARDLAFEGLDEARRPA